jgi:hypothetical protein
MNKGLKVFLWIVGIGLVVYIGYKVIMANKKSTTSTLPGSTSGPVADPNIESGNATVGRR